MNARSILLGTAPFVCSVLILFHKYLVSPSTSRIQPSTNNGEASLACNHLVKASTNAHQELPIDVQLQRPTTLPPHPHLSTMSSSNNTGQNDDGENSDGKKSNRNSFGTSQTRSDPDPMQIDPPTVATTTATVTDSTTGTTTTTTINPPNPPYLYTPPGLSIVQQQTHAPGTGYMMPSPEARLFGSYVVENSEQAELNRARADVAAERKKQKERDAKSGTDSQDNARR